MAKIPKLIAFQQLVANNPYELINEFREDEVIIFFIKKL